MNKTCWYCEKNAATSALFNKPACERCKNADIRVLDAHPETEEDKAMLRKFAIRATDLASKKRLADESTVYGIDCRDGKCEM